jgi:hypothetical protein
VPWPFAAGTARPLSRCGLTNRCHQQAVEIHKRVVAVVLGEEAIDDIYNSLKLYR